MLTANYAITYQEVESGAITAVQEPVATTVIGNNMVSPNGDGVNDYWTVSGILNFPLNIVTIYDRSGRIVFTQRGYANTWGCSFRGALLAEDPYYYKIDLGNGSKVSKGFITLIYNRN